MRQRKPRRNNTVDRPILTGRQTDQQPLGVRQHNGRGKTEKIATTAMMSNGGKTDTAYDREVQFMYSYVSTYICKLGPRGQTVGASL